MISTERCCFVCGAAAAWRIALAGEDEQLTEDDACDLHAHGHIRIARLIETH
jgi:hypothetical protein